MGQPRTYQAVIERDSRTGFYVAYVPGFTGAHTQAESLDELNVNLREVIEMLLEDGEPRLTAVQSGICGSTSFASWTSDSCQPK